MHTNDIWQAWDKQVFSDDRELIKFQLREHIKFQHSSRVSIFLKEKERNKKKTEKVTRSIFHLWATEVVSFKWTFTQMVFVLIVNDVENNLRQLVKRAESSNYYIFPKTTNWGRKKTLDRQEPTPGVVPDSLHQKCSCGVSCHRQNPRKRPVCHYASACNL